MIRIQKRPSAITALLTAGLVVFGTPVGPALAAASGTVSGYALDAGGRPLGGALVELLPAGSGGGVGVPLETTRTTLRGSWEFPSVAPGEYVVRLHVGKHRTGAPVSLSPGAAVEGVRIIAPSAALQAGAAAGGAAATGAGGSGTLLVLGAVAVAGGVAAYTYLRDAS